ncbi:MAG: hypothetical protein LBC53_01665, partial [Spirochaetaceae bacterium]|nr:hypothetical protein [Spirochaetaceae bacterium]
NRAIRYNLAALAAKFRYYPLRGLMAPLPANTGANSRLGCGLGAPPPVPRWEMSVRETLSASRRKRRPSVGPDKGPRRRESDRPRWEA